MKPISVSGNIKLKTAQQDTKAALPALQSKPAQYPTLSSGLLWCTPTTNGLGINIQTSYKKHQAPMFFMKDDADTATLTLRCAVPKIWKSRCKIARLADTNKQAFSIQRCSIETQASR